MRTILWFLYEILYLAAALPDMFRCRRMYRRGEKEKLQKTAKRRVRNWARSMLKFAGVTVEVHGLENLDGRPAVFVSNHQSDWDIPVVLGYLDEPYGIVAKDSLAKIPCIKSWMDFIGCIFIDRSDARKALRTINEAGSRIPEGDSIIIFPEGTRSKGEEIGEFKNGAFKTAIKYKAPIVPLSIDGSYKIMEANGGKWIRPGHVIRMILPPVDTQGLDKTQQKSLGDDIRRMILDAREESRRKSAHP